MFDAEIQETQVSGDAGVDARGKVTFKGGIEVELVAHPGLPTVPANLMLVPLS